MEHIMDLQRHVGVRRACESMGMPRSSYYARRRPRSPRIPTPRPRPVRALSEAERLEVLAIVTCDAYVDKSPASIVSSLLDAGRYVCSERTIYRILGDEEMVSERRAIVRHPVYSKPELMAQQPREVWTWDITKLKGPRKGLLYSLYVVLDMFSRYVVGWLLADREGDVLAEQLLQEACKREGIPYQQLTIHADNGGVMRSGTVSDLLANLGVAKSHSRPHCSNDNPYSESQFKTMKYSPGFPTRFESNEHARAFCREFFDAYNHNMYHSGIAMLTPATVHQGQAHEVIEGRQNVLSQAFNAHPERFVNGMPAHRLLPREVWINKPLEDPFQVVIS